MWIGQCRNARFRHVPYLRLSRDRRHENNAMICRSLGAITRFRLKLYVSPKFGSLFEWINAVNLTGHSGSYELVSHRAEIVRFLASMMIDAYGSVLTEKRSDMPNEKEGFGARPALNSTRKTIRN